ncbi:MAG: ATP-dependent Clp protease adaptor ClpS [Phycisphaeraceae bacterium]|nr:ATP-dependent Clp protease adaptor ClpS [Phycisphaeraceae bacterium]
MPEKETHELAGEGGAQAPTSPEEKSRTRTATATKPSPAPPKIDELPPFKVLLHNDEVNDMLDVVQTIVELTPLRKDAAIQRMLEAHSHGVSLLLTTHKERAELYREQFQSKNLVVSIEAGG